MRRIITRPPTSPNTEAAPAASTNAMLEVTTPTSFLFELVTTAGSRGA